MSTLTEDKAREMWCPFVRVVETDQSGQSRARNCVVISDQDGNVLDVLKRRLAGTHCIASDCMAWRTVIADMGYCGLAGKPEPRS